MSPGPFPPGSASGGQGQMGFYILLDLVYPGGVVSKEESDSKVAYLRNARPTQEEDNKEGEENIPRMYGVHHRSQCSRQDADRGQ